LVDTFVLAFVVQKSWLYCFYILLVVGQTRIVCQCELPIKSLRLCFALDFVIDCIIINLSGHVAPELAT